MRCDGSIRMRSGDLEECPGCRDCSPLPGPREPRFVAYEPRWGWLYDDGVWREMNGRAIRSATAAELSAHGLAPSARAA